MCHKYYQDIALCGWTKAVVCFLSCLVWVPGLFNIWSIVEPKPKFLFSIIFILAREHGVFWVDLVEKWRCAVNQKDTLLLTLLGGKWAKSLVLLWNSSRQKKYCKLKALLSLWLNFVFSAHSPKVHFVEYERETPASAEISPFSFTEQLSGKVSSALVDGTLISFFVTLLGKCLLELMAKMQARVLLGRWWSWSEFAIHSQWGMFPSLKGTAISSTSRWKDKSTNYFFIIALVLLWAFKSIRAAPLSLATWGVPVGLLKRFVVTGRHLRSARCLPGKIAREHLPSDHGFEARVLQCCTHLAFCLLETLEWPFRFTVQKKQMGVVFVLYAELWKALWRTAFPVTAGEYLAVNEFSITTCLFGNITLHFQTL